MTAFHTASATSAAGKPAAVMEPLAAVMVVSNERFFSRAVRAPATSGLANRSWTGTGIPPNW